MAVRVLLIEAETPDEIRELATSLNLQLWSHSGSRSTPAATTKAATTKAAKKIERHKAWTAIHEDERAKNPGLGETKLLQRTTDRINQENEQNFDHNDVSTSTVRRHITERPEGCE